MTSSPLYRTRPALAVLFVSLLTLVGGCMVAPTDRTAALSLRLDEILHRLEHTGATVAARVVELDGGGELYARRIDEPCKPASNMKLLISATGLATFGPDHLFETYLAYDGANLWIIGTGDPAVGDPKIAASHQRTTLSVFDDWAETLRQRGISRIPGSLIYCDGALDDRRIHPTWNDDDLLHWYAAEVSGLNFNDNCVDITVRPADTPGALASYDMMPPTDTVTVVNQCLTGDVNSIEIRRLVGENTIELTGTCNEETALKSKPVRNPGRFFVDAMRRHLASKGITIDGETLRAPEPLSGSYPPDPEYLLATHGTQMQDVLWRINKSSQNLFAECLCKLAGQAYDASRGVQASGSWLAGERAIRAFLQRHGIDHRHLAVADGSGLSHDNRVTSRMITDLLAAMQAGPMFEPYLASLCVAGEDGTLARRMKPISGHVFAKTGYIRGVRALSGYIRTRSDRWLAFSFLYNNIPGSIKPYEALQDEACAVLVEWPQVPDRSQDPDEAADTQTVRWDRAGTAGWAATAEVVGGG